MNVTFIRGNEINSDLGVVNAARVSLAKKSDWIRQEDGRVGLCEQDKKLLRYLGRHNHWTPFAHPRIYFEINWQYPYIENELQFYHNYNPGGFAIVTHGSSSLIKGSLYSWVNAVFQKCFSERLSDYIFSELSAKYPEAFKALYAAEIDPFAYGHCGLEVSESYVTFGDMPYDRWKVLTATLFVKVPLFVARQIRTSQVGFAYSDAYVEGEAFSFNEVSRRYVDDDPEFYKIEQWRVREGKGIKQGSTGIFEDEDNIKALQLSRTITTFNDYREMMAVNIAPEQARALLPQSMYTEFYMTATLHRWAQFIALRSKPDVQYETREVTALIAASLATNFPQWVEAYPDVAKVL